MSLDHSLVGVELSPVAVAWDSTDAILYALGVGAGAADPLNELAFTTENTEGVGQQVLPTFAAALALRANDRINIGDHERAHLVHAGQGVELLSPLPPAGTIRVSTTVAGIFDKGSGALVVTRSTAVDAATGEPYFVSESSSFIRGEGGFGGERGPSGSWHRPDRAPDHLVRYQTRPEQALLYRLSGDRNPLHTDPAVAARGGFDRPILHGLSTYGFAGRALLQTLCGSSPTRFRSMTCRFTAPVRPGDTLTVSIWLDGGTALFQTARGDGMIVIDHGRATAAP